MIYKSDQKWKALYELEVSLLKELVSGDFGFTTTEEKISEVGVVTVVLRSL